VLGKLEKWSIPANQIHIEVTESVSLGPDATEVKESLATLRKAGVMVALDDFGTGYASLTHLQDLPFDYIKIDRSFIARSEEPSSASIIKAMIGLSTGLGKGTVAEGVETTEQARFLKEQGCQIGQGHLFGRPAPAEAVPDLCYSDALKRDL
jgi:EAL domain-containing protein (putative c-di-GMP-specific phosphodiesterase class I)